MPDQRARLCELGQFTGFARLSRLALMLCVDSQEDVLEFPNFSRRGPLVLESQFSFAQQERENVDDVAE